MAPTPTPTPVSSSPKDSDTISWVSTGLIIALCITLVTILGMSLRIRDYIVEKREEDDKLVKSQNALRDSESDRKGLQREADLLSQELQNWRTLYAECWVEMTAAGTFCRENHSHRPSDQPNKKPDVSTQTKGPDVDGSESRIERARPILRPTLSGFARGDAAHYVVDGRWQVPQQIKFGDMSTIHLDTDDAQIDNPVLKDSAQDPNRDPDAPNDAHAGHGRRE
ncbi:hypothetical protein FPOAC2_00407 [Fusarium poae]|uniref:Uncharacterized protein n=1 Tax=Fusarium poae TaxID=36050 RepID=A0A1B8B104_FUSPO|nr:hypothetical protein FPOAC1_000359 [Fusarium poae]KAG8674392.1 hypothetical protein FPOAC1_000359 [Fusarium poae]OBS26404.1 hypothetical protein FPOA_00345 [Fusarium poae]